MTFFGKFFVLVNAFAAFALFSWGLSIYVNRVDWSEVQDGDRKLTDRTKELAESIPSAQKDYARMMGATASSETEVERRREQIEKRLAESETGTFYELNKGGSLIDENPTEKVEGLSGGPLRGTKVSNELLTEQVELSATAGKEFDETRKAQSTFSDEIAGYEKKSKRLKALLVDLREEEIFLADSRVNWDEQLVTLQKRNRQLQAKLAEVDRLQKELKLLRPSPADAALRTVAK